MSFYFIDGLRNESDHGEYTRRYANSHDGEVARLTYGFLTEVPDSSRNEHGDPRDSFYTYSRDEKADVAAALRKYETVANVHFEIAEGAASGPENANWDIAFGQFDMDDDYDGYTYIPIYDLTDGELWGYVDEDRQPRRNEIWFDAYYGVQSDYTILHEIGHALGLKHPFEGRAQLSSHEERNHFGDSGDYTVMSYDEAGNDGFLGIFDIIALQSIYGPARLRRGDNTYVFGDDKLIWDGGGEDKITARDAGDDVRIDLAGGTWNYEGGKRGSLLGDGQVFLGHFTQIENLDGGDYDDRLSGNALANRIGGRDGDDLLRGLDGSDRLVGGLGDDSLSGGAGGDKLLAGAGDDTLNGGKGGDELRGGAGADLFVFSRASDSESGHRDLLLDFRRSEGDKIDLSDLASSKVALAFIGSEAFSGTAGEVRFDHRASAGTRILADLDGDGSSDFAVALAVDFAIREGDLIL